jgi:hypothetical protein
MGFIAVYPETVVGNPLEAPAVARWVLNVPGYLGGERKYADSEAVFCYANGYLPYLDNRLAGMLHLPTIDESIFFNDGRTYESRSLECFYVGKGRFREGVVDRKRAFEITRSSPAKRELGKIFRASRVLYCFDSTTVLAYEAALCGCPVVIVSDGVQSRKDYEMGEIGLVGLAWYPEGLGEAIETITELPAKYQKVKADYRLQLAEFVRLTQGLK